ncbi:heptosyltransferase [Flavobacterium psychrophilum]|nr:heptosyltransferase [Flavobacterium psychrophilum]AIN72679.1 heptosyltransferase [Flavobacterium psychrophilum FPG101]ROO15503.1 heptosyltransferase [Flavobacterium psychrophilum 10]AIG33467.1 heptosyltransferase [Flavobacterium psychrophilum]AIG35618.1 heptosyltransferase [Flavobacterium psychrophilum]
MRLSAMGDAAMTVPVLRAFILQYPDVKITVVSKPFFKPFFDTIPNVNFFGIDINGRHKGFLGLIKLFLDLRKLNIDAVADLHNVIRSKAIRKLFLLFGKKVAASNKGRADKKALTRVKNKIFKPLKTMFILHCDTFAKLGFDINLNNPNFPNKAVLSPKIISITGNKNQQWVGIAPFAQYESKVYPQDLMQQTINDLSKNNDYKILLFGGGKKEIEALDLLAKGNKNVINIAGRITFQEELNLISNLDIMLSMDSGNAHIAAMLGVKVITLWGATHPFAGFSPFNQPLENALVSDREKYPSLPTSVYGNKDLDGYQDAMRTILPETIVKKLKESLSE